MGYTLFGFCDRFASYWMTSPDDPQFCVISKSGHLPGLGQEPVKGGRPKQQAVLPENQAFSHHVHGQWETRECAVFLEKTAGS